MNSATRQTLIEINRQFYERFAGSFSQSRSNPWRGWERLLPLLSEVSPLRVLDVGCGNGRLASYLARARPKPFNFHGLDASPALLRLAREQLSEPAVQGFCDDVQLEELDVVGSTEALADLPGPYDFVALFGVLHHVPGIDARVELVRRLAALLSPDGVLALSCWRFDHLPRFDAKTIPWEEHNQRSTLRVDPKQLETGDYLLTWKGERETPRYCHRVSREEANGLAEQARLRLVDDFLADGPGDVLNRYLVMTRPVPEVC